MNKRDLVDYVCSHLATTKAGSEEIVSIILQGIQDGLRQDGLVALAGFGTWEARRRRARTGRNPQTGEPIPIPPSTSISFRAAKAWKDQFDQPG